MAGKVEAQPVRSCVACRRRDPKDRLLRVAIVGGCIRPDRLARQPGRGAYLCTAPQCLDRVMRGGGATLRRALRADAGTVLDADALAEAHQAMNEHPSDTATTVPAVGGATE